MVLRINAVVPDHFKVPVRDMYNESFDKVNGRDAFRDRFMILMALIMEGHGISIIGVNPGSSNDWPAKVSADVLNGDMRGTQVGFGSDIKSLRMVFVELIFKHIKGIAQSGREFL